jgi:hypothetical protein
MARQRLSSSYNRFHFIIKLTILAFLHKYLHSFLLKCIERFRFIVKKFKVMKLLLVILIIKVKLFKVNLVIIILLVFLYMWFPPIYLSWFLIQKTRESQ